MRQPFSPQEHTHGQAHLQHSQLQDLISLLLPTRKALVHVSVEEGWIHV